MNISRIDLNLFVVFDAIYTGGGITRASETLTLSQPTISHALGRLRKLLNDPLFIRQGNAVTPTALAHELIGPIRRALAEIEDSLNQVSTFDPSVSEREFKIGMPYIVEFEIVPDLMNTIKDSAPSIKISAVRHNRSDFHTQLSTGLIAVAVDVLRPLSNDIHHKHLSTGKLAVVARKGHPAVDDGQITMASYLEQDHILASSQRLSPGLEDYELARLGFQRHIKLRCQHCWTACKVVSTSDMLFTMNEHYGRSINELLGNQLVPFPTDIPPLDLFIYWHASVDNDHANRWLREQICASFNGES
ncbi:MAG: LysR family transcriptional regulator [Burkholderiales bacterium RIFCSPLOWO2_02_FULL_57_36]|nr:MAG: LysR family transcriptional regulator [Burkholderiales bacterium RIFCSPLOWO2_02_FULL_57_36]